MNRFFRPAALAWLVLVVVSAATVWSAGARRAGRLEHVSGLVTAARPDAASPTGYVRGMRNLVLPELATPGQPWVMDVQQQMAAGTGPLRKVDYDNAPDGRAVHGASPYRWWLRLLSGEGGAGVERAALRANPLLHVLLCLGLGLLTAWRFGPVAGGLLALGIAALFPFSAAFMAGQPDDHGLLLGANLTGLLLLLAGSRTGGARSTQVWFAVAGMAGGLGLWLEAGSLLIMLAALTAGGVALVWQSTRQRSANASALPWRLWAAGGALVSVLGWFMEGRPGGIGGQDLATNHPLLALAWLGAAEALMQLHAWRLGPGRRRLLAVCGAALLGLAPVAWLAFKGGVPTGFGPVIGLLSGHTSAANLLGWLKAEGLTFPLVTALLPLLLAGAGVWAWRRDAASRPALALALGTAAMLLPVAACQLRWWGLLDAALLGLLAVAVTGLPAGFAALGWRTALVVILLPGLVGAWPRSQKAGELSPAEARALIERDLAQWLAARSDPGAIAFAPPGLSAALCYHGGLRVVASPYRGNQAGLALAGRIASVASTDEAQALFERRGIRYVVLSSSDRVLDEFARIGTETPERTLIALLRQWLPPRWLRPVPYLMPAVGGMERETIDVFEVVEPQENVTALSRLAEYFVETGRLEVAAAVGDTLEKNFGHDAGAMIARARVALARGEARTLARILPELLPAIADGRDEDLPWERRANLALVLAQAKRPDLMRTQVEFCLAEADLERLRSLGPVSLFRFLGLAKSLRLSFADPTLHEAAVTLLPEEFRAQLAP